MLYPEAARTIPVPRQGQPLVGILKDAGDDKFSAPVA